MNDLFRTMNGTQNNNVVNQIRQFAGTINGDPKQQVQQLLNSGRMTQEQYNNLVNQARQLMPFFKK